ncbi:MAG TPA: glycosyl hydrolase family 28-related protein [Gemmatimonadales bacterium]|nr:glycosyl hydrolase family 28-related protein [Gemmatimonadales bacterium]
MSERNVKDYGAVGDGVHDDAPNIQAALNAGPGTIFFPAGTYLVGSTLTLALNQQLVGASVSGSGVVGATLQATAALNTANGYVLQYQSALTGTRDEDAGLEVRELTIAGKNGLQLNRSGDYATVFSQQAHIKSVRLQHVTFLGAYGSSVDPNYDKPTAPTQAELDGYGVGFRAAKLFDSVIDQCRFEDFGCAVRFDGCDINTIRDCRMSSNARHFYSYAHDTYGSQNRLEHNDLLAGHRVGHVYLDAARWHTISDNYFETYGPAGTYIKTAADLGTLIYANRFDNPAKDGSAPTALSFDPAYGLRVVYNRWNPSAPTAPVEVLHTNWAVSQPVLGVWKDNIDNMPVPNAPAVLSSEFNPYVFSPYNLGLAQELGGVVTSAFPFVQSLALGRWAVRSDVSSLLFSFPLRDQGHRSFLLRYTGRRLTPAGGYHLVSYLEGGTSVPLVSGYLGFTGTPTVETRTEQITLPSTARLTGAIHIELVTTEVEYAQVELVPQ